MSGLSLDRTPIVRAARSRPKNSQPLSAAMVAQADLLIAFKQYPHTDVLDRAFELVDLCAAQVAFKGKPVASVVDGEMAVILHTPREPAAGFVRRLQALEGHAGVLSITVTHGFPWGDVPDMGAQLLVYTDAAALGEAGARAAGQQLARRLADELIALREQLDTPWLGHRRRHRRRAGRAARPGGHCRQRRQPRRRRGG